jgi:type I restriction enzyme S subunit
MSVADTNGWATVRLGDIGQSLIGLTYSLSAVKRSGTLVLRSSNIQDRRLVFDDNVYVNSIIPDKIRVRENDILICVRNGSRRLIGKSVTLDRRVIGQTFGAFMAVYRSSSNRYLQYFFQSDDFKRQIDEHLGATINQITNASLNSFVVALPSLAEQEAIVSRLTGVDRYITTLERMIAKKQAIKQGMMQQLLTGKTDSTGSLVSGCDAALGAITTWSSGGTPDRNNPTYWGGTIPWISAATLKSSRVHDSDQHLTDAGVRVGSKLAPVGAVLVLVRGMALHRETRIGMTTRPVGFNQDVKALIPKPGVLSEYLLFALQARSIQLLDLVSSAGSGTGVLDTQLLQRLPIWVPDEAIQRRIIAAVDAADREVGALDRLITKMQGIKQGMMQQLLTGRTRLPAKEAAS